MSSTACSTMEPTSRSRVRQKARLDDQAHHIAQLGTNATHTAEMANGRVRSLRNMLIAASLLIAALLSLLIRQGRGISAQDFSPAS